MRIVSLLASATEMICSLGLESQLVGRSHECDYPASILRLPQCTETKFKTDGSSSEIDFRIKEIVKQGLSVYRVFEDRLRELKPDVIVTQIQCEVCAVSEKDVLEALCSWLDYRPKIVSLNPTQLEDIWKDIHSIAQVTGVPQRATQIISHLKERMAKIANRTEKLSDRPSVACIEWIDPLMSAGNWMPDLVQMAGGKNLLGSAGKHSPYLHWADLLAQNPEIIIIFPCGWNIERTLSEIHFLTERPEWSAIQAVQKQQVFIADGNQYFNRPGPRIVESLEILAEIIHPRVFNFGFEDKGWTRGKMSYDA